MTKKQDTKKNKPEKKTEPKSESKKVQSSGKKFLPIISIIVTVCIIGIAWLMLSPSVEADEANAQLVIDSGTVQVKHEGESWTSAENGMLLYQSDTVKTGDNSTASIILFKTSIVRLDSNTEVMIKELIQQEETNVILSQDSGRTWNAVSKMSGIDNYEVQTPTTVATVRGTAFDVYILANGNITISIGNGTVNVTVYENGEIVHSIEVPEYISVTVDPDNLGETPDTQTFEPDEWILLNQEKDEEFIGNLKEELLDRIEPFRDELKELFGGPSDEELDVLIDNYIMGSFELPANTPDWARKLFEFK